MAAKNQIRNWCHFIWLYVCIDFLKNSNDKTMPWGFILLLSFHLGIPSKKLTSLFYTWQIPRFSKLKSDPYVLPSLDTKVSGPQEELFRLIDLNSKNHRKLKRKK